MLYTTYYNKMNLLPDNIIKIIISLYPPKWLQIDKTKNIFHSLSLAPDEDFFIEYLQDKNWELYKEKFNNKIYYNKETQSLLNNIITALHFGKDIALICFEKNYLHCHRYLLVEYLLQFNIEWKEY